MRSVGAVLLVVVVLLWLGWEEDGGLWEVEILGFFLVAMR
jgi:hypothetical protein